ncbi:signal peptidase II [Candidatus Omnitrophota bacterium]
MSEVPRDQKITVFCLAAAAVFAADWLTKMVVTRAMTPDESIAIVPGVFHITLIMNKGMAFGLLQGGQAVFIGIALLAIAVILLHVFRSRSVDALGQLSLGLILGGTFGNLLDRIRLGYVVDFLDLRVWPVFNLADSSITIGAFLLAYKLLFNKPDRP